MSKKCIGCKRELAKHETSCPACGAEQNIFKYHRTSIIVLLMIISGLGYAASRYVDSESSKIRETVKSEFDENLRSSQEKIEALSSELASTKSQLESATQNLDQLKTENNNSSNQAGQVLKDLREKLADTESELKKQQGRAGWLGRENSRIKTELDALKKQIETLSSSNTESNSEQGLNNTSQNQASEEDIDDANDQNSTENEVEPPTS
jgi:chromosome segregation ATPase